MRQLPGSSKKIKTVKLTTVNTTTAAQYYMDVRNGKKTVEYLHKDLEPILKESNGVFVYQEEVMKFLVEVVGYTWEESDVIRGAIAKKKHEVIMSTFDKIREAGRKRGWNEEAIETLCQQIMAFSRYSFNKSHSYAYGELGYITMYLKHHHPLEWWASILNLSLDDEDKMRKYISRLGHVVRPPSLRHPTNKFEIRGSDKDKFIVTPISAIKGIGPAVVNELITKGPFESLEDFVQKINHSRVNSGSISALIKGRAADDLMDLTSSKNYSEVREKFISRYIELRGGKVKLQEDVHSTDPLSIFLLEKQYNQAFNKNLLSDDDIVNMLLKKWSALKKTGRSGVPLTIGETYILANIKVAEGVLNKQPDKEIGLILLYEGSEFKRGISKKGKPWSCVSISLSDGYSTLECTDWDRKAALGWEKGTVVYVRGTLKPGWKTPVSMQVVEIEKVE